jgi:hypothetical protein
MDMVIAAESLDSPIAARRRTELTNHDGIETSELLESILGSLMLIEDADLVACSDSCPANSRACVVTMFELFADSATSRQNDDV